MERAVVGDHLGGEECDADDNQEECVEKGASDEETGPEIMSFYLLFDVVMDGETDPDLSENIGPNTSPWYNQPTDRKFYSRN